MENEAKENNRMKIDIVGPVIMEMIHENNDLSLASQMKLEV